MPHLSHSTCEMVAQCMRRYYLIKVEGVPQSPSTALLQGTSAHAAFEVDGRRMMAGETPLSLSELLQVYEQQLCAVLQSERR